RAGPSSRHDAAGHERTRELLGATRVRAARPRPGGRSRARRGLRRAGHEGRRGRDGILHRPRDALGCTRRSRPARRHASHAGRHSRRDRQARAGVDMTRATGSLIGYWDRQAATYDRKTAGIERRLLSQSRRWVGTRARGATLEIGVGTGANLPHYPDDVDLTAVDWSTAMLDAARAQAARVHRPVTLRQADGAALPFPAGTFDTVLATFVLCCVPDVRSVL